MTITDNWNDVYDIMIFLNPAYGYQVYFYFNFENDKPVLKEIILGLAT
jgi:hypothetical protein